MKSKQKFLRKLIRFRLLRFQIVKFLKKSLNFGVAIGIILLVVVGIFLFLKQNFELARASGGTIQFARASQSGSESENKHVIEVVLNQPSLNDTNVEVNLTGGTAIVGVDFSLNTNNLTIKAGKTSTSFAILLNNNNLVEENKTIELELSNPQNATLGTQINHTFTILDDDIPTYKAGLPNHNPKLTVTDGLRLWLDGSTLLGSNDSAVSSWLDQSGNGYHATQDTTINQPLLKTDRLNGKQTVYFDGSNDFLSGSLGGITSEMTVFSVNKIDWGVNLTFLDFSDNSSTNRTGIFYTESGELKFRPNGNEDQKASFSFSDTSNFHLFTATHSAASRSVFFNGLLRNTNNSAATFHQPNNYRLGSLIGGGYHYRGDIAEVLVYNKILSAQETQQVNCYLGEKYNLAVVGCGTSIKVWYDAGKGITKDNSDLVSQWNDQSGNNNHATQGTATNQPLYVANGPSSMPTLRFDGTNDRMAFGFDPRQSGGLSFLTAAKLNTSLAQDSSVLSSGGGGATPGIRWGLGQTNQTNGYGNGWGGPSSNVQLGNDDQAQNFTVKSFIKNYSGWNIFRNSTSIATPSDTSMPTGLWSGFIGSESASLYFFNGDISEVLVLNQELPAVNRIIAEHYLANKYNLSLAGAKFINKPQFQGDLTGIGSESGSKQWQSGFSSGLQLTELSNTLGNGEYIIFSHNQLSGASNSDLPSGIERRWNRIWALDKTSTDGINAKFSFDFSQFASGTPTNISNYRLLYRSGDSGNFSEVSTQSVNLVETDKLEFEVLDANLSTGYYTLGTIDSQSSPLGISGKPTNLVVNGGLKQATLSWDAPTDGVGGITDYRIEYSQDNFVTDFNVYEDGVSTNTSNILLEDLPGGLNIFFRVIAINAAGFSMSSDIQSAFIQTEAPEINSLSTISGRVLGGTTTVINGQNFYYGKYFQPVTLNNPSSSAYGNWPVKIVIDSRNLIKSGKLNENCSNFRVKDTDTFTPLSFWLEKGCNTAQTVIWVRVPGIAANASRVIYFEYLEPSLASLSSLQDTIPPLGYSSQTLWIKADAGISVAEGDPVTTWQDQSGNNNHLNVQTGFTGGSYLSSGFNGNPTVRFSGSNSYEFTTGLTDIRTAFFVVEETTRNQSFLLGHSSNSDFHREGNSTGNIWNFSASSFVRDGTTRLNGSTVNGTTTPIALNTKSTISVVTTGNVTANRLDKDRSFNGPWIGDRPETIIYNQPLSSSDVQLVEAYLNSKYGINQAPTFVLGDLNDPGDQGLTVKFNSVIAPKINFISSQQIEVITPPSPLTNPSTGLVNVTVVNPDGQEFTLPNSFEYKAAELNSITPNNGLTQGKNQVSIEVENLAYDIWQREINFNLAGEPILNTILSFTFNTRELIEEGKMNSDCSDLRVWNINGETVDFWLEQGCNTDQTRVWLKQSLNTGDNKFLLIYGDPDATSSSNFQAVFPTISSSATRVWFKAHNGPDNISYQDPIGTWNDQSGNNNHASISIQSRKPRIQKNSINSLPVVRFDGADDQLILANPDTIAQYYTVFKSNTSTFSSYGGILEKYSGAGVELRMAPLEPLSRYFHNNPYPRGVTYNQKSLRLPYEMPAVDQFMLLQIDTNNPTASRTLQIAGLENSYPLNVDIAEIIGFNQDLSADQRHEVSEYLRVKYALYGTVPTFSIGTETPGYSPGTIKVNGKNLFNLNSQGINQLTAVMPSNSLGTYDLEITQGGITTSLPNAYSYQTAEINSISNASGPNSGGTYVKINGSGFNNLASEYTRVIQINNPGSAISGYLSMISLDTKAIIAAGKMRPDCGDIRLFDQDGTTALAHFVEDCGNTNTRIWFKIPGLESGLTHITLTYGNPSLSSNSNISDVFSAINPTDQQLWLNAGDIMYAENDFFLEIWPDRSGNGNNARPYSTQTNTVPRYLLNIINGQPVVRFDGGLSGMTIPWSTTMNQNTVFLVANPFVRKNHALLVSTPYSGTQGFYLSSQEVNQKFQNGNTITEGGTGVFELQKFTQYTYQNTGSAEFIYKNGSLVASNSTTRTWGSMSNLRIGYDGSSAFWRGDIAEIMIFSTSLSSSQRQEIETYLNLKYNLTASATPTPKLGREQAFDLRINNRPVFDVEVVDESILAGYLPSGEGTGNIQLKTPDSLVSNNSIFSYGSSTIPNPITDLAQTGGNLQIKLNWTLPNSNGSAITGHQVQFATNQAFSENLETITIGSLNEYELTGLTNNTQYYIRVRALNSNGTAAEWSNIVTATPKTYSARTLDTGPTAYWRLGDLSGTVMSDSSGNSRNGTYHNSPTLGEGGALLGDNDTSVRFSGSQYGSVADEAAFRYGNGNFSVSAWVYFDGTPKSGVIYSKYSNTGNIPQISMYISQTPFQFQASSKLSIVVRPDSGAATGPSNTPGNDDRYFISQDLPVGWHHVVLTNEYNKQLTVYINGERAGTAIASHNAKTFNLSTSSQLYLGGIAGSGTYNDRIDEVAVYNKLLTPQEVKSLYYTGNTGEVTLISQANIDNGSCQPDPLLMGNSTTCTFPLVNGTGNYILPDGGDTTAQIESATGVSNACFVASANLVCPNTPSIGGIQGSKNLYVNVYGESGPPAKGQIELIPGNFGQAMFTPVQMIQTNPVPPIYLNNTNLNDQTPATLTLQGSTTPIQGQVRRQISSIDATDGLPVGSFTSTAYSFGGPAALFNNNTGDEGVGSFHNNAGFPMWVAVDFGSPRAIARIRIYPRPGYPNRMPNASQLQYFDGSQWQTKLSFNVDNVAQAQTFTTQAPYNVSSRWRLLVTSGHGDTVNFSEIEMFEADDRFQPDNGELVPSDSDLGNTTAILSTSGAADLEVNTSVFGAFTNKVKAKTAPDDSQPISDTPTVSLTPSFTSQTLSLTVSGLIDSGNDLPLNVNQPICKFVITDPNNQQLNQQTAYPVNGTCQTQFNFNQLEGGFNFVLKFDPADSSTGLELATSPLNFERLFNIYRINGDLPVAITTTTSGYPEVLIRNQVNNLSSGSIKQSSTPTNLIAGLDLSNLSGKHCRIVLKIENEPELYYNSTLNSSGICTVSIPAEDVLNLSEDVISWVEVSFNNSNFDFDPYGDDFSSAATPLSIRNPNNSQICLSSFRDDNGDGVQGLNVLGFNEPLLTGVSLTKALYDQSNQIIGSGITNTTNPYCFSNLFAGDYYVSLSIPEGTTLTYPEEGAGVEITPTTVKVQVTVGQDQTQNLDFGYQGDGNEICVDPTFIDINQNSQYNSGIDTLLDNFETRIYHSQDLQEELFLSPQYTDNNGKACFAGLPPTSPSEFYRVVQDIPQPSDPGFPAGGTPIIGITVNGQKAYRDLTLSLTQNTNTIFGYIRNASNLAKEDIPQNPGQPVNTGVSVSTVINPTFNDKAFVNYPVSAKVIGLIDSANDELLNGSQICEALFEGPGFGSGVTVSNIDVVNGECVVDNSNNSLVVPNAIGNNHFVTFKIQGENEILETDPYQFEVFSGEVSICTNAFFDHNENGISNSNEVKIGGFEAYLILNSNDSVIETIEINPALPYSCFDPVDPGVEYRVEYETDNPLLTITNPAVLNPFNPFPEDIINFNVGLIGNSEICPISFRDDNNNGINDIDPDDPLITNSIFSSRLYDNNGNLIGSKLYDGTANSCFGNLIATEVTTPNGPLRYTTDQIFDGSLKIARTTPASVSSITLSEGQNLEIEFGYRNQADICYNDTYRDYNKNGLRNSGELFITGIETKLYQGMSQIGSTQNTMTGNGNCFNDPIPGTYTLTQTVPSGYNVITTGKPTLSQTGNLVSYEEIVLSLGVDTNLDIGYKGNTGTQICASPTFKDIVNSGVYDDPGDLLFEGITTTLRDQFNTIVATGSTNSSGQVCFDELLPTVTGQFTYRLTQTNPDPTNLTPSTGNLTRDINTLSPDQTVNQSYGYRGDPLICPVAFRDDNENGVKDLTEPYLNANITIKDGLGNPLSNTGQTPNPIQSVGNGDNCFAHSLTLNENYQVTTSQLAGYDLLNVSDTQNVENVEFATRYKPVFRFKGSGKICVANSFNDFNRDGEFDIGIDTQIEGLETRLKQGLTTIQTIFSSNSGNDCFTGVNPGTYSIEQIGPTGSASTSANPITINLSAGIDQEISFGYSGASIICVVPFNDNSANGKFDGIKQNNEDFINGLNAQLYLSPDFDNPIDNLTNITSGTNCFEGLYGGDYRVVVDNFPSGFVSTTGGETQNFTLENSSVLTRYFGYTDDEDYNLGRIRGKLFVDRNKNSLINQSLEFSFNEFGQDNSFVTTYDNDVPITDQEVLLFKLNEITQEYEFVTSILTFKNSPDPQTDGYYDFIGLDPGNYRIEVPLPQGTKPVFPDPNSGQSPFVENILITTSEKYENQHFTFQYDAKICPLLFVDFNYNGVYDEGIDLNLIQEVGAYYRLSYETGNGTQFESNYSPSGYLLNSTSPCIQEVSPRTYTVLVNDQANVNLLNYGNIYNRNLFPNLTANQSLTVFLDNATYEVQNYYWGQEPPADNNTLSSINGRLYNDRAANGVYEPAGLDNKTGVENLNGKNYNRDYDNDFGYEGVELQLFKCSDAHNDIFPASSWNLPTNNLAFTTTGSGGYYSFENVPPGGYAVIRLDTIDYQEQLIFNRINSCQAFSNLIYWNNNPFFIQSESYHLTPGTAVENYHIWARYTNSLTNSLYIDQNKNGIRDYFEFNFFNSIGNTLYQLQDENGLILEEITGDPSTFQRVPPGTYITELAESNSPYPANSEGLVRNPVVVNNNNQTLNYGFDPYENSEVNGYVFIDRDLSKSGLKPILLPDGIDENPATVFDNEIVLENYQVELYYGYCQLNSNCYQSQYYIGTFTTGIDGYFEFPGISEGYYHARVITSPPDATVGDRSSWGWDLFPFSGRVFVPRDAVESDQNLTFKYAGKLTVDSFFDTVADGVFDSTWEVRNNSVEFEIEFQDGYIVVPASLRLIEAMSLPPGEYTINLVNKPAEIELRPGFLNNPIVINPYEERVIDLPFTPFNDNKIQGRVFVDRANNMLNTGSTYNFQYNPNGFDNNASTIFDNDIAIAGANVLIQGPPGVIITSQTTNSAGQFTFENLPSGRYLLHKLPPDNDSTNPIPNLTLPSPFNGNLVDICFTSIHCKSFTNERWNWFFPFQYETVKQGVALERTEEREVNYPFAYTNSIKAQCIDDFNGNGVIDYNASTFTNDAPMNGCSFRMLTPYAGEVYNFTSGSNASFFDLPPGNYTIEKTANAPDKVNVNTTRYSPSLINYGNVNSVNFSFSSNAIYQPAFFNFFQTSPAQTKNSSITGKVYIDRNKNLVFQPSGADNNPSTLEDNDVLLSGISLFITGTENQTGSPVNRSTSTSQDGRYQFTDLAQGEYTVTAELTKKP